MTRDQLRGPAAERKYTIMFIMRSCALASHPTPEGSSRRNSIQEKDIVVLDCIGIYCLANPHPNMLSILACAQFVGQLRIRLHVSE